MLQSLNGIFAANRVQKKPASQGETVFTGTSLRLKSLDRDTVSFSARREGPGNAVSYTAGRYKDIRENNKHVIIKGGAMVRSITTDDGDILLKKGSEVKEVITTGGTVTIEDGAKVETVKTDSGQVKLKNHAIVDGDIHTNSGKILLQADSYAYELHTNSGHIQLNPRSEASTITSETGNVYMIGDPSGNNRVENKGADRYTYAYDIYTAEGEVKLTKKSLVDSISTDYGMVSLNSGSRAGKITTDYGKIQLNDDTEAHYVIVPETHLCVGTNAKVHKVKYLPHKEG
jgi:hypothetical protein